MNQGLETRILRAQSMICAAVALLAALWPQADSLGLSLSLSLGQGLASGLGSIALIVPSALFALWSKRQVAAADSSEHAAQKVLGLAGLRIVGSMTLMVIAFALMRAQAQWVLVGVAAAAIGQVVASVVSNRRVAKSRP